jgi:peptide/nickel transport system substrate-binding protein
MIFLKRRRLIFWLLRAYIKRWRRTIFTSFILGILAFFILRYGINYFIPLLPFTSEEKIGVEGSYTADELPTFITSKVSMGLTTLDSNYKIRPGAAERWEIKDDGRTYIFYLKEGVKFSNNKTLTSSDIEYNFIDVTTQRPNENVVVFRLKNRYSPFLVTVSRPIFKNGFTGLGNYKVQSVDLNGNFVRSISLRSREDEKNILTYYFYPTQEALKSAFALGEVDKVIGLNDTEFERSDFARFKGVHLDKQLNDNVLITVFLNTNDRVLSDKRLREALAYATPDEFEQGKRNHGPFSPNIWVNEAGLARYSQDFDHAQLLLKESDSYKSNSNIKLELKTYPKYLSIAKIIEKEWEKIGVQIDIVTVDNFPSNFQMFLSDFSVPRDPDQYMLWHSEQRNNIANYRNLRIDKLLEDGRQISNTNERKSIYADFQKYLLDDAPAIFLMFPYQFTVSRI